MSHDLTADERVGKLMRVVWLDSGMHRDLGWASRSDYLEDAALAPVETVGFFLAENDEVLVLAQSWDSQNDHYLSAQIISVPSVRSREWLA